MIPSDGVIRFANRLTILMHRLCRETLRGCSYFVWFSEVNDCLITCVVLPIYIMLCPLHSSRPFGMNVLDFVASVLRVFKPIGGHDFQGAKT